MDLTIVIIAGNEEKVIQKTLKSIEWCKNIVLVAANSTDNTKNIVKKYFPYAKIVETNDSYGKSFHKWRNIGLKQVKTENILYLDADETVPNSLRVEIKSFCNQNTYSHAAIPRQNLYLGKKVRYGGSFPDYQKRLFKTNHLKKWIGEIHEQPIVTGKIIHLKSYMIHNTHRDLQNMTKKSIQWSEPISQKLYQANHPYLKPWRLFRVFFTKFTERFILQGMWRDGMVGLISSMHESYDSIIIYSKLWEKQA